jgi:hypothetical protein
LPSKAEQQEIALLEIDRDTSNDQAILTPSFLYKIGLQETTLLGLASSTLVRQINRRSQSPLSIDQTLYIALFTFIANKEALSPLIEGD